MLFCLVPLNHFEEGKLLEGGDVSYTKAAGSVVYRTYDEAWDVLNKRGFYRGTGKTRWAIWGADATLKDTRRYRNHRMLIRRVNVFPIEP